MALVLPNDFVNLTPIDAAPVQQNFTVIESHVNTEMIPRDGTVPMTGPLVLPGAPSQGNHASTKAYVDGVVSPLATTAYVGASRALRPKLLSGVSLAGGSLSGVVQLGSAVTFPVDPVNIRTWVTVWDLQAANANTEGIMELKWANEAGSIISPTFTLGLLVSKWAFMSVTFTFVAPANTTLITKAMLNIQGGIVVNVASWVNAVGYVE